MTNLQIGKNQGITQAIASKLTSSNEVSAADLKNLNVSVWKNVMQEVNASKSTQTSFTSKNNDAHSINAKNKFHSNSVINQGNMEIDDGVWSKICNLIKNAIKPKAAAEAKAPEQTPAVDSKAKTETTETKNNTTSSTTDNNFVKPTAQEIKTATDFNKIMSTPNSEAKIGNFDKYAKTVINGMDSDGKAGLTAEEFANYQTKTDKPGKNNTELYKQFQKGMDLNNDGIVSAQEYSTILKNADQNGDKIITNDEYFEFTNTMSNGAATDTTGIFSNTEMNNIKQS